MTPTNREEAALLCTAIHETGHAVAFKAAGITVNSIEAHPNGEGGCDVDETYIPNMELFLMGVWAGAEAQARWIAHRDGYTLGKARRLVLNGDGVKDDRKLFKRFARATGITSQQAWKHAQKFVGREWGPIKRLGTKLADRGKLTRSAL